MIKAQLMCSVMERWRPYRSVSHCVYLSVLCEQFIQTQLHKNKQIFHYDDKELCDLAAD